MPAALETIAGRLRSIPGAEYEAKDPRAAGVRFEAVIPESELRATAAAFRAEGWFLETIACVDWSECFELAYFFNRWEAFSRCVVKVVLPKGPGEAAEAPSIHDVYEGANWHEREAFDMYGVRFRGHPNLKRLLLPESSSIHPLRKSFKGEPDGSDVRQIEQLLKEYAAGYEIPEAESAHRHPDEYVINLGPQHPSTHGVLRIMLRLRGERVIGAEPVIGYVHRNQEKMGEVQEYKAFWPNMGRLDYVGAMAYNLGYASLVERAMGVEPSERVQVIRVLFTELNRVASHLLWLGTYLLDLGAFTPFFYCFDDRENILDILENATGERLTYDYFRFGGLDKDIPEELIVRKTKEFIPRFRERLRDYDKLLTRNVIFRKRTVGVGVMTKEAALGYGVTGPCLRGSGVAHDVRRQEPHAVYDRLDFDVPVKTAGDAFARYLVRMREMSESLKIVEQLIDRIPKGEIQSGKLPRFVPKGEYYCAVESARGSFGMYLVSDGTMQPYRMKLRTPSFSNLSAMPALARGAFIADIVSILGSLDIVVPEIDR